MLKNKIWWTHAQTDGHTDAKTHGRMHGVRADAAKNNAFVIALLHLTYFLLPQLSDFNRTFKQNWTSLLYLTALASTFLKMAFLYSPYAYLLFLMLLYLS